MDPIAVRNTLDELIRAHGEDYASVSRRLGRNPTYIQQFIKRGVPRRLHEEDRRLLADHFGVPERVLGGPDDRRAVLTRNGASGLPDDYILIPYLEIGASAGGSAFVEDDSPQSALAFQDNWVREIAHGHMQALSVIHVQGDSMLPTLSDGDHILVNTDDGPTRLRDGIYVLRVDGALLVKRIAVNPSSGLLTIKSDNAAYPSWSDCDPASIAVIGRVVWVGRKLA